MKKLAYLVSAVAAGLGFSSSAFADISVSGGSSLAYTSAGSTTKLHTFGNVSFGLSTTTASGMTISSSAGISASTSSTRFVTGWDGLTFATGGASIEIGTDVALADGVGEVHGVNNIDASRDHSGLAALTSTVGITNDEGVGLGLSTSFGGASVSLAYVADTGADGDVANRIDDATGTGGSVKVSTTVGSVGVTAAYVTHSDTSVDDTETALSATYASDMGTFVVGYGSSTGASEGVVGSVAYTMALDADTSLKIGYASYDMTAYAGTETNVGFSRSLGGGASVFADFVSADGDTGSGENSAMAVGTSIAF